MNDYRVEMPLAASASAVYDALTTPQGLQAWWTSTCEIGQAPGEQSTFRFGRTFKVMDVERLEPGREVAWRCARAHIHAPSVLKRPDEWVGTTIVFRLRPQAASSTLLQFEHRGLVPSFECFGICSAGWDHFLASLKSYVETGVGTPHLQAAA